MATALEMARCASAWLDSLREEQRALAVSTGPAPGDPAEDDRLTWFFTPTDHGGLTLHEQSPRQQSLAMQLVSSALSLEGFASVSAIMGLENVLDRLESWRVDWGRERGRDPQLYYLRVFGRPGQEGTWAWRFGGHHVSLNVLVVDGRVASMTPNFLGADPAETSFVGGEVLRPLGASEDLARELFSSLSGAGRRQALLLDRAPADIVAGNRTFIDDGDVMPRMDAVWRGPLDEPRLAGYIAAIHEREEDRSGYTAEDYAVLSLTRTPKGIIGADLSPDQRTLLQRLIATYTHRVPREIAEEYDAFYRVSANLDSLGFAWAGSSAVGAPHYYRVQGPRILIEYDNTQRLGNHCHAVWRDPVADFGLDVLYAHVSVFHRPAGDVAPWPVPASGGRA
ncbi:MAG TPA: DUF3500 domain-containing protein [Microbacteriaceae bacterium]|nr:DUF3500 domain-containing protein [Microbacteriaceae bacterium]